MDQTRLDLSASVFMLHGATEFPRVKDFLQAHKLVRAANAGVQHHLRVVSFVCSRMRVFHPFVPDILTNHTLCITVTVGRSSDEGLHEFVEHGISGCVRVSSMTGMGITLNIPPCPQHSLHARLVSTVATVFSNQCKGFHHPPRDNVCNPFILQRL